jgi:hypothetical protein
MIQSHGNTLESDDQEEALAAIKTIHPYEEPVINVIELYRVGL